MTIIIETDEKHLPMFKALAKEVDAKVTTRKKTNRLMTEIEEGLKEIGKIRRGEAQGMTLEEALYGK